MRKKLHHHFHQYLPFYDDNADYNTNAKSYYDYLARQNKFLNSFTDVINRLLSRDLQVENTKSILLEKIGEWLEDEENCVKYSDEIILKANVNLSKSDKTYSKNGYSVKLKNGTEIVNDGVFSPDFTPILNKLFDDISLIHGDIVNINERIDNILNIIDNIVNQIDNINKRIDSILGINSKSLVHGRDYQVTFYNGFSTLSGGLQLSIIESDSTVEIILRTSRNSETYLVNSNIVQNAEMRHSNSITDTPKSRVLSIEFKGDYAYLNSKNLLVSSSGSNLWNISPTSARASWNASLPVTKMSTNIFMISWSSYADGYNSQLSVYDNPNLSLSHGNMSINFTILK